MYSSAQYPGSAAGAEQPAAAIEIAAVLQQLAVATLAAALPAAGVVSASAAELAFAAAAFGAASVAAVVASYTHCPRRRLSSSAVVQAKEILP